MFNSEKWQITWALAPHQPSRLHALWLLTGFLITHMLSSHAHCYWNWLDNVMYDQMAFQHLLTVMSGWDKAQKRHLQSDLYSRLTSLRVCPFLSLFDLAMIRKLSLVLNNKLPFDCRPFAIKPQDPFSAVLWMIILTSRDFVTYFKIQTPISTAWSKLSLKTPHICITWSMQFMVISLGAVEGPFQNGCFQKKS